MSDRLDAFVGFAGLLVCEDGSRFVLEDWQREVVGDLLEAAEALVLIGKGDGKTTLLAAFATYHLLATPNAAAYCAAASRDQASLLFAQASGFVRRSPELSRHLEVKPGYRSIRALRDDGFLKVLAADADTADGVAPTLACIDELHRHKDDSLYSVLRDGLGKRGGSLVTISTAGALEDSALGRLRAAALALPDIHREGAHTVARSADGRFVAHEWAVPSDGDVHDIATVKQAHPSSFVTVEGLTARHDSPSMRETVWRRLTCNQWVRTEGEAWITAAVWDRCAAPDREIRRGEQCVLALDGSYAGDSTALVGCTLPRSGELPHLFVGECWELGEESGEDTVPILEVEDMIVEICRVLKVREIAADPFRWQRSLEVLAGKRLPIVVYPQSPSRMVPATQRLYEAITNGEVTHDGDERLRRHVTNAIARDRGHGVQIAKESRRAARKIDLAAAAVMAFDRAHHYSKSAAATCYAGSDILYGVSDLPLDELRATEERERAAEDFELDEARRVVEELRALVGEGAS